MASARLSRLRRRGIDGLLLLVSGSVLAACLFYTVAYAYQTPISGITTNGNWEVTFVDGCDAYPGWCEAEWDDPGALQVGDHLISIGGMAYQDYIADRRLVRFAGYGEGAILPIVLSRDEAVREIEWRMPPISGATQRQRLNLVLFYLPFWLVGTIVILFLRPRDERSSLLAACNYLTAIWTVSGAISTSHIAASSLILHAVTWIMAPAYLHFQLVAPSSLLKPRHRRYLGVAYGIAFVLAVLELYQFLPTSAFYVGLLVAILGSAALLLYRLFDRASSSDRPALRLMLAGIALSLGPGIILWIVPYLLNMGIPGAWATEISAAAIPILPLFFAYALRKRYLGKLELYAHRFLSLYGFVLLYVTLWVFVLLIGLKWVPPANTVAFVSVASIFLAIAMQPLQATFRRLAGRIAYGTGYDQDELLPSLVSQIHSAHDLDSLYASLARSVIPSLSIRQSAMYLMEEGTAALCCSKGIELPEDSLSSRRIQELLTWSNRYRPPLADTMDGMDWVRLVIPMRRRKEVVGLWLFGQRDPDDYYPQKDITFLDALGSQAAVSIENIGLYSTAQQEIAERRQAESALWQSEERYRDLMGHASDGIVIVQDGLIRYANPSFAEMRGGPVDESIGIAVADCVRPDDVDRVVALQDRYAAGVHVASVHEVRIQRKDGTEIDVEFSSGITTYEGKPADLLVVRNLTEHRKTEREREHLLSQVQEQAQRVQKIMNTVPEGVMLLDGNRRVILANPAAEETLSALADACVGDILTHLGNCTLEELLSPTSEGMWHDVITGGSAPKQFEVVARPVRNGPTQEGWVLVARDVTQEQEIEQRARQRDRLAAVGQLAAGIAHDFNNMLTTIILYAQILRGHRYLPSDMVPGLETILDETRRATDLVGQILDFSRSSPIETHPVDLRRFIKETVDILKRTIREDIRLRLDVKAERCTVAADPTRLQQVMMNLVINARDAMPEGGELRFTLDRFELEPGERPPVAEMLPGEWVCITVSDTGAGIPPEVVPHIFEPFFTTKDPGKGTGLGLAQVYGIVRQHGGHVGVETEVGRGTTFHVCFPAHVVETEEVESKEARSSMQGQGETILLVEDEQRIRELGRQVLESVGYHVLTAADGQEALVVYRAAGRIDLVITDLVMPNMGGEKLLQELRQIDPSIKALAITGYVTKDDLPQFLETGFIDVVRKPFDRDMLAEAVQNVLSGTRGQTEGVL